MKRNGLSNAMCAAAAILALTVLAPVANAQQKTVTLRLSTPNPASHPYTVGAKKFADLVSKATNGSVRVDVFPDNQLGSPAAVVQGVQLGTIDMGIVATAHLAPYNPEMASLDLPFLFADRKAAYSKLDGALGSMLAKGTEAKNIVVLTYFDGGFRNIFNARGPVFVPGDLHGLKLRVINSPVTIDTMDALGGTPVPLAWSDLYTSLQQGVVRGGSTGLTQLWSQKFYEICKFVSLTNTVFTAGPVIISKRKLEALTPAQQEAVRKAAVEATKFQRDLAQKAEGKIAAKLKAAGVKFNEVDKAKFRAAVKPVWDKYGKKFSNTLMENLTN